MQNLPLLLRGILPESLFWLFAEPFLFPAGIPKNFQFVRLAKMWSMHYCWLASETHSLRFVIYWYPGPGGTTTSSGGRSQDFASLLT